ncbi:MAG TPA: LamG-like jellyroll fold domain-containing protein [Verrucomicrobiae bacterium]
MKTHCPSLIGALYSKLGLGAAVALIVTGTSITQAQNAIGFNLAGRQWSVGGNTPMTLNVSDMAGVVLQQNWNNVMLDGHDSGGSAQIGTPNAGVVSDNSGAATGVTFSYTPSAGATEWATSQTIYTGNHQLLNGYWDIQGTGAGTTSFGNIPYSSYDVYVYVSSDGNGRTASVSLNGGAPVYLLTDASGYNYATNLLQGTATVQGSAASAHYVLFTNVTGSSFNVVVTSYGSDIGVAGIQIVDASGTIYQPVVSSQPAAKELYTGGAAQFTVSASGTSPFGYHWRTNGIYLNDGGNISGSASNVLTVTNITLANAANYDVVITNIYGSATSMAAQLTVVAPAYAYEQAVSTNHPFAYYRFNESNGDPTGTPNLPAFDYIAGANGVYGVPTENLVDGINGPQPSDGYPGFENGNGAVEFIPGYGTSQVTVPAWNISTNTMTMVAWVYPLSAETPNDGLIVNRGANVAGLCYSGSTNADGNYTLGYVWNNDPTTFFWDSGLVPPANQWSMVTLVVTPTDATIYLANTSGINAAVHTYPHAVQTFSGPIAIGNDPVDATGNRVFNGNIDEVSIYNRALSESQVLALLGSASGVNNFFPQIAVQPVSQAPFTQQNARFSVTAVGSQPFSYQWQVWTNGTYMNLADSGRISGSQAATLTLSNVALSDPTNYLVIVTNVFGAVTSSPAALTVTANSYANAVLANGAIAYYSLNELGNPAAGGLTAYDYQGGFNGLYGTHVQNGYYGVAGPRTADGFSEFPTNNWAAQIIANDANGHIVVSPWNLNTNTVTMTCWIHPTGVEPSWAGLVFSRGADGTQAGLNFSGSTDANGNRTLSYTWGNNCCWNSQLTPPTNQWSFVALVVTSTNATVYLFNTNGTSSAANASVNNVMPFSGITGIGLDPFSSSGRNFSGVIDEVAVFNQVLSPSQIAGLYQVGAKLISAWDGNNLNLSWTAGTLLQSTNLLGPWTTNGNSSPFIVDPKTNGPQMFYRVLEQ